MFRTVAFSLAFSLAITAAPAHAAGPAGWDHPGFDAEDSYYNPGESAINAGTVGSLTRRWQVSLRQHDYSCGGMSAPLVAAGRVIATDKVGISAYHALTGAVAWRYDWPDPGDSKIPTLAVAGSTLIAANGGCNSMSDPDGVLTALDLTTGRLRWRIETDIPVETAVVDKNVVVISGESESDELGTFAYRALDGKPTWEKPGFAASSVSADGRVLLHEGTSTSAVAITTGAVLWTKPRLWRAESATPAADRFLVTDGTALTAVVATTGAVAWTAPGKAAELVSTDGRRVYRAFDRTIEALSAATGRPMWSRQLSTNPTQPLRAGGLLYTKGAVLSPLSGLPAAAGILSAAQQVVTGGRLYTVSGTKLSSYAP